MAKKKEQEIPTEPNLELEDATGIVKVLRATLYEDHMVYVRQIYEEYFEYLFNHENQIYSSYIIATLPEGRDKMTEQEVQEASALVYNGAMATIDVLIGKEVDDKTKEYVELFEGKREQVEKALEEEKDQENGESKN